MYMISRLLKAVFNYQDAEESFPGAVLSLDAIGNTPLDMATHSGNIEIFSTLLSQLAT